MDDLRPRGSASWTTPMHTPSPLTVEIQGHRGARALRPENTLDAFAYAAEVGADVLEMDLLMTADDHIVVAHDPTLSPARCLDALGRRLSHAPALRALTLAQLKGYDCGALPHPRFPRQEARPGARVPTLDEVFRWAASHPQGRAIRFNLEVKLIPGRPDLTPPPADFARGLIALIRAHEVTARVNVQCFDGALLHAMAAQAPEITRALLIAENRIDHVAAAAAVGARIISPHHHWITAEDVARMHAAGLRVIPWTLNAPEDWRRALEMGVDGIITDDPAGLRAFLRASPQEREAAQP
ncbi:glycerophosphodiester phosphodiesterase [Myxococcota bacterium]|nr:glycerophosphodiester phosphodiesterase [Myxococcota bacterium]MBU1900154.1 glycerophosphodiester phosphodiesterase [Myxococcota bacterium]